MINSFFKIILLGIFAMLSTSSFAGDSQINQVQTNLNTVWTLISAALVFFMQAGFACLEIGLTRSKNAINVIMKNLMDFSFGSVLFLILGFGLMFGETNGFLGTTDFFLSGITGEHWNYTFLIFQTVFAGTAATIVSGAMVGRTKFTSYLFYSIFITGLIYPISGSWAWGSLLNGNGWLENLSTGAFVDFAGSTVVHSLGGWLALAGAWVIGPRMGKFSADGESRAIPGHNIPLASLGVFILWFGWFGFNSGSTTTGDLSIGRIAVTTNLSAAMGAITAMFTSWIMFKKADATMSLNGALAGLVGITAGCATVTPFGALLIGSISGILVVLSILFIENVLKIDDPVGASSVHGVCGAWGTIACGLFNAEGILGIGERSTGLFFGGGFNQLISQFIGVGVFFLWAFGGGVVLFYLIKIIVGLRVTPRDELDGLDISEHGLEAYFQSK